MKIHWRLKLDEYHGDDELVVKDEAAFRSLLSAHLSMQRDGDVDRYVKWNNIDFKKQMAVIVAESACGYSEGFWIDSVWQTERKLIVLVASWSAERPHLTAMGPRTSGVAVNKVDLPVEFRWCPTD